MAIVGTRRFTAYGQQVAEEVSAYLAQRGITVVSGLARGIDSIAHNAALNAGGRTIAVLGSGVANIYLSIFGNLAYQIHENGAILSDYSLGTAPEAKKFSATKQDNSGPVHCGSDCGSW